jgi:hypothetical protein
MGYPRSRVREEPDERLEGRGKLSSTGRAVRDGSIGRYLLTNAGQNRASKKTAAARIARRLFLLTPRRPCIQCALEKSGTERSPFGFSQKKALKEVDMLWDSKFNIKQLEETALKKLDTDALLTNGIVAAKKLAEKFREYADWWEAKATELEKRQADKKVEAPEAE